MTGKRASSIILAVEVVTMQSISRVAARANLIELIDKVNEESEPVTITGDRHNAVLIGEDDWRGIREALHLEQ